MIAAPASRSASQSARSATRAARFVRMVAVARPRFARSWSSASAARAASGNGGVPRNVGSGRSRRGVAAGLAVPARPAHPPSPVEARISARCMTRTGDRRRESSPPMCIRHDVSPAVSTSAPEPSDVVDLVVAHRDRRVGVLDRERPAEAAARLGSRQVHQGQAVDRLEQPPRPVADPEQARRMAGRMERDRVREARADVGHAEDVDEELAQLEDARRDRGDPFRQSGPGAALPGEPGHDRMVDADHRGARARRRDHDVVAGERVDEPFDERDARRPGSRC